MRDVMNYYFEGFVLSVDAMTYLVRIRKADVDAARFDEVEDLPEWAFQSRLAIWLMEDEAPILQRSLEGDKIRSLLLSRRMSHVK